MGVERIDYLSDEEKRYLLKLVKREEQKAMQRNTSQKLWVKILGLKKKLTDKGE